MFYLAIWFLFLGLYICDFAEYVRREYLTFLFSFGAYNMSTYLTNICQTSVFHCGVKLFFIG